jgi:hypothetical protein
VRPPPRPDGVDQTLYAERVGSFGPRDTRGWADVRQNLVPFFLAKPFPAKDLPDLNRFLHAVTRFARWAAGQGITLDPDILFRRTNVDRYVRTLPTHRATVERGLLNRYARVATRTAELPPPALRLRRWRAWHPDWRPLSEHEQQAQRRWIERQRTPKRRRSGLAVYGGSIGASLVGTDLHWMQAGDLIEHPEALSIRVRDRAGAVREVPVRRDYDAILRELADGLGPDDFLTGRTPNLKYGTPSGNVIGQLGQPPPGCPRLNSMRGRYTWMLAQLRAGNRPDLIQEVAGLDTQLHVPVLAVMAHLERPSPGELRQLFRNA